MFSKELEKYLREKRVLTKTKKYVTPCYRLSTNVAWKWIGSDLSGMFTFAETAEGHEFWWDIFINSPYYKK